MLRIIYWKIENNWYSQEQNPPIS